MADAPLTIVARHIHRMANDLALLDATDGQLLERFVASSDEGAFAVLLRRHGPMVYGIAHRVLGRTEDADDVFQATFLVLVRGAKSVRKRESVGSWLHGVAYRVAVRAKAQRARRWTEEKKAAAMRKNGPSLGEAWLELQPVLDQEIARLPEKYRSALVLCYLRGKTQEEAARQLGCPLGTVRSRLARARMLLQKRLTRRGLALSTGSFFALLAVNSAPAAVPTKLLDGTLQTTLLVARGRALGAVSASVAALVDGVLLSGKLKIVTALLVACCLAAEASLFAFHGVVGRPPEAGQHEPASRSRTGPQEQAHLDRYGDPLPEGALARLGTVRFRHGYTVTSVAFSPDSKLVASGEHGGRVHVWDVATGKERCLFTVDPFPTSGLTGVDAITFSSDGTRLIAGGDRASTILVWQVVTGKEQCRLQGHQGRVFSVASSPDNRTIASGSGDRTVRLWDVTTGKELRKLNGHEGWVRCVAFSPDGAMLASCGETIRLWQTATGKELRRCDGHRFEVNAVAFSPDGRLLASGSSDKTIRLWEVATGKEVRCLDGHQLFVLSVAFSPDGKNLVTGGLDGSICLWQTVSGKQVRVFQGHEGSVASVALSPDGQLLASVSGDKIYEGGDRTLRLWKVATGKELRPGAGHQHVVSSAAFAADGTIIVTGSADCTLRAWNATTGEQLWRYLNSGTHVPAVQEKGSTSIESAPRPVQAVAISPEDNLLASAGPLIWLRDAATGKEVRRLGDERDEVQSLAFSLAGKSLASGNRSGWLRLYEMPTGRELRLFGGGYGTVVSLAPSPDGKTLAAAHGRSGTITLWEAATGKLRRAIRVHQDPRVFVNSVTFSPDGKRLATGLAAINSLAFVDNLYLWDATTGRALRQFRGQPGQISAVAFSPDGKMLASASGDRAYFGGSDKTIGLWEIATGQQRCSFRGHQGGILSIAFAPDGRSLVSTGEDTTAIVWDVTRRHTKQRTQDPVVPILDLESAWRDLGKSDAAQAHTVIWTLVASPRQTLDFLIERLRPASNVAPTKVETLISELESESFAKRERAMRELQKLGDLAGAALRRKLQGKPTLDMRHRVERLLQAEELTASPDRLQEVRAIEVLEHIGSPQAKQLLTILSRGALEARLSREAKATLERLARQPATKP